MSFFTVLVGSKIAIGALAVGTVAAGGTAAAAYAGALPAPLQQSAHSLIGAPVAATSATATATATPAPSTAPVGPDATGHAAFGLCQAYTSGGLATSSIAYNSLMIAANGAANITDYCAAAPSPGKSSAHRPTGTQTTVGVTANVVVPTKPQLPPQAANGKGHTTTTAGSQ